MNNNNKTNPNDAINSIVETSTDPYGGSRMECIAAGLTKREYFASNITVNIDDYGYEVAKQFMDSEVPKDRLENLKWWMEAEARMKVLKADALIKALNNEQQ